MGKGVNTNKKGRADTYREGAAATLLQFLVRKTSLSLDKSWQDPAVVFKIWSRGSLNKLIEGIKNGLRESLHRLETSSRKLDTLGSGMTRRGDGG